LLLKLPAAHSVTNSNQINNKMATMVDQMAAILAEPMDEEAKPMDAHEGMNEPEELFLAPGLWKLKAAKNTILQ
jgi:hypothetical protein